MKDEQIKEWCHRVWKLSWLELAPSSNSRALFVKEMNKLDPDQDFLNHVENRIIVQTRHWRNKSKREKVFGIPRLSQWIKDRRFDDPIEIDIKEAPRQTKSCEICGNEVHGPRYTKCTDCVMQFHGDRLGKTSQADLRKQKLIELNLPVQGVSLSELASLCRERLLKDQSLTSLKNLNRSPES